MEASRIESVDVLKALAVVAVIALHTQPFRTPISYAEPTWDLALIINQLSRFAVPFFFVISGYFWGVKLQRSGCPEKVFLPMAARLFLVFTAWSIVYIFPFNLGEVSQSGFSLFVKSAYWNLVSILHRPFVSILQGTKSHLWFLISLIFSLAISHFFVQRRLYKTLIALSLILYLIGILGKAYADTPIGLHIAFNTRNGPFFSTIFFVTGYFLSSTNPQKYWFWIGIIFFGFGCALHFFELFILWKLYRISLYQDYLVGTYFMGIGTGLAALSSHSFLKSKLLSLIGKSTLGIYAIHIIFVELLSPIAGFIESALWQIFYVIFVLIFSYTAVWLLSKNEFAKRFVF